ncbi:MAG: bifunctional [glutamine synthetase] adenylyltransferase/[glutamine synthetase]-adenylyl-L-tyrosine phosphorylase [Sphingobium sp.]
MEESDGLSSIVGPNNFAIALALAQAHAPFLAQMLRRWPDITDTLMAGEVERAFEQAREAGQNAHSVAQSLRLERGALALVTAIADLSGTWDLTRVTTTLSDFADRALERAIEAAFVERYPGELPRGFAVIALGKHGSRELNYSSDIDPILIFDPETIPHHAREEPVDAAVRLARRVTELLSARDGDGYVFRVDLRLRPSPEITPIALPVEAAIGYYESMALGWEQAAFIRARVAAGDGLLGDYFLRSIRPFIWRRSLDFGAVEAITDISRRIRDHYAQGQVFGPGYDLKRGRGGIREVEFFAQVHQLIHGGRNSALRSGATREALSALAVSGIITPDVAANLTDAYVLLRTIEHRLQMVDDLQTHELPATADRLDNVARLHGLSDGRALLALLESHVKWVGNNYDQLIRDDPSDHLSLDPVGLEHQLIELGFADPQVPLSRIAHWRTGSMRALRSAPARSALEDLLPPLMATLARAPDPATALNRLDDMISRLPSAINFFKLLAARPALVQLLAEILSHAPTLADALARRAELLDGLIDASAFDPPPALSELIAEIGILEPGDDYQMLLDRVRQRVGDKRFALGAQIVRGAADPLDVAAGYSRVAEAAIDVIAHATITEFEAAHGRVPGAELAILALGRLGGGALTHASDLDVIYLFSGDFAAESEGAKPLGATQYFNRLAQRITNALSVQTGAGPLYEVDTRLRPSGAQGLLAVSFDSFERYQHEAAWAWEHLALTRARPIFGSEAARTALQKIIDETLAMERDGGALARAAVKMRADIATHKPPARSLDAKLVPGGLVDLEFLIHVTQFLTRSGFTPDLRTALNQLIQAGHLPASLLAAHDLITRFLLVSRLVSPKSTEPPEATRPLVARACSVDSWDALLARYAEARQDIGEQWGAVVARYTEGA